MDRKLIKNAHVLTMDETLGYIDKADILVEGSKIVKIAPDISADDARIIDGTDMLAMPGFVDGHRHTWQSLLRASAVDWTLAQYLKGIRGTKENPGIDINYTPEDMYTANWLGAIDCLDAGITTLLDWSHNSNSPEHVDGAIKGLIDSGIRSIFAYGDSADGWKPDYNTPIDYDDVRRVRKQYFPSDDQMATLAIASLGPQFTSLETLKKEVDLAKELDIFISTHVGDGWLGKNYPVKKMYDNGLLSDKFLYVHCNTIHDEEFKIIGDTGATAVISPEVELNMGHGFPATLKLKANGVSIAISGDVCTSSTGDMFSQMRAILSGTRSVVNNEALERNEVITELPITAKEVLKFATVEGADACKMGDKVGSLTPGKEADIIMIDTNTPNMVPFNNPVGIVVEGANVGNVKFVMVGGNILKRDGKLVGIDYTEMKKKAEDARDRLYKVMDANPANWMPKVDM